jgi:flagellar secretion chaperone FliS
MTAKQGYNQYKQMSVLTSSRGQVLILLYEAAIQNVKKATLYLEKKDWAGKGHHILKAHDILNELVNSLDFDAGGDIARNLERLYNFMIEQLIKANIEHSKEALQTVQKLLETLLSGWREAVGQTQKGGN